MTTMKAVRMHEYGTSEVLKYEDAPKPAPGDGEVLVRVRASSINPVDKILRAGFMKAMVPLPLPYILGLDVSGDVEAVGAGVTSFAVGDEVFGKTDLPKNGTYAQYACVAATGLVKRPRAIEHAHAASIPLAALTAWQALFDTGVALQKGQSVLITGAAGGVGSFAMQLAKWKGARVVAAGRAAHADHARKLGADVFVDTALGMSAAGTVDAVVDLVGGDAAKLAWAQLKEGGAWASAVGAPSADDVKAKGARAITLYTKTDAAALGEITKLVEAGTVKTNVSKVMPLERAREAHELLEARGVVGKIVLSVD